MFGMDKKRPTVVLVDDSASIRLFFEKSIDAARVEVLTFASATDSMAYLDNKQPDLLVLDNFMPEKDGLTFLQELRRLPLHQSTAVILVSSKDYAQDRTAARELGVLEFVPKPMNTKTIQELIDRHTTPQVPPA
jgi:DNA-binding response OmpR family regulator